MLDPKVLQKIADNITDPFLEGAILDRRGLPPDWTNPPAEESFADEQFGGMVHEYRHNLRRELEALASDTSVLAELAKTDPAAARQLEERREEAAALQFIHEHPEYYVSDANASRLDAYLDAHHLPMTAESLAQAYHELSAAGRLQVSPHEARTIPAADKIRLARMAANGDIQNALAGYLDLRMPKVVADEVTTANAFTVVEDIINRPENQPLLREALIEVWLWAHPKTPPTLALRQWFADYTKDMLAFNAETLDHAYFLYLDQRESQREARVAEALAAPVLEEEPTPAGLEGLSDAEVAELMRGVARVRAAG